MSWIQCGGVQTGDSALCVGTSMCCGMGVQPAVHAARFFGGLFFMRYFRYRCGRLLPATGLSPTRTC